MITMTEPTPATGPDPATDPVAKANHLCSQALGWVDTLNWWTLPQPEHMQAARTCLIQLRVAERNGTHAHAGLRLAQALKDAQDRLDAAGTVKEEVTDQAPGSVAIAEPAPEPPAEPRQITVAELVAALDQLRDAGLILADVVRPEPEQPDDRAALDLAMKLQAEHEAELDAIRTETERELADTERELAGAQTALRDLGEKFRRAQAEATSVSQLRSRVGSLTAEIGQLRQREAVLRNGQRRAVLLEVLKRLGMWAPGFEDMPPDELEHAAGTAIDEANKATVRLTEVLKHLDSAWFKGHLGPIESDPVKRAQQLGAALVTARNTVADLTSELADVNEESIGLTNEIAERDTEIAELRAELDRTRADNVRLGEELRGAQDDYRRAALDRPLTPPESGPLVTGD
jgi:predicted  nucleic acid-binding Zn-ribbon protein